MMGSKKRVKRVFQSIGTVKCKEPECLRKWGEPPWLGLPWGRFHVSGSEERGKTRGKKEPDGGRHGGHGLYLKGAE